MKPPVASKGIIDGRIVVVDPHSKTCPVAQRKDLCHLQLSVLRVKGRRGWVVYFDCKSSSMVSRGPPPPQSQPFKEGRGEGSQTFPFPYTCHPVDII